VLVLVLVLVLRVAQAAHVRIGLAELLVKHAHMSAGAAAALTPAAVSGLYANATATLLEVGHVPANIRALLSHASALLKLRTAAAAGGEGTVGYRQCTLSAQVLVGTAERRALALKTHIDAAGSGSNGSGGIGSAAAPTCSVDALVLEVMLARCSLEAQLFELRCRRAFKALVATHSPETIEQTIARYVADDDDQDADQTEKQAGDVCSHPLLAKPRLAQTLWQWWRKFSLPFHQVLPSALSRVLPSRTTRCEHFAAKHCGELGAVCVWALCAVESWALCAECSELACPLPKGCCGWPAH
jgi:hypothetical protein